MSESTTSPLADREKAQALNLVDELQHNRSLSDNITDIPKILLPYQARWHADNSPVRICEKSRRIGFSWGALAAEAALEAASLKSAGGMDQFYMGYNMRMAAEFIGDCAFFARSFGYAISEIDVTKETIVIENERRDIVTYKIEFASGHKIEALSSNPHNWRSRQGHARIDEAAFHQNIDEVIKGALAFRMWGGRIDIVSTHNGEDNKFNQLIKEVKAGKLPWALHRVTFDDALREGFYERVCLVRGKDYHRHEEKQYRDSIYADYATREDASEELDCIPKRGTGAYFTRLLLEHCQDDNIPIIRYQMPSDYVVNNDRLEIAKKWINDVLKPIIDNLPPDQRSVLGQDFGRNGDLSVIWVLQEQAPRQWRTGFILELRNIPFDVQKLIVLWLLNELPLLHHAKFDARGNGQSHAEAALQEIGEQRVECVMLSASWYATWFPKYRAAYEDKSIIIPKSEDIIADHRLVQMQKGQPRMSDNRIKGSDGQPRHGDSAIAGLLAWAATHQEGQPAFGASVDKKDGSYLPKNYQSYGAGGLVRKPERRKVGM